ncbi:asparagine synthase-related protein [Syntrophomonas wolfei]|uniref:asparagine synthase-related protein n=1 Tax=Syntrophomonas wolfei TaxID=863 RepID=UPI0023EFA1FD|nr:asparagine synthase-related protein [Syntrophomonas wolfei]
MSAICGVLYKHIRDDFAEAEAMFNELGQHKFDVSNSWQKENVFLGCHLLHIVPESVNETLPFYDHESSLVITADAIIDNRAELFSLLAIPADAQDMPDSMLILSAYKKWGVKCPEKLAGDFAFVIWDKKKQELFCARDQVGKRSFYYYHANDKMAFCTLMKPLFKLSGIKKQLNDVYVADFLALPTVSGQIDPAITIYKDIYPLPPAHAMLINVEGKKQWQYWRVEQNSPVRYKSDAEYEEAFREVYIEAVRCRLRSIKPVGVYLSGGLDSASVAAIAAKLNPSGEKIYGFTQVPMEGYVDWLPKNKIADEKEYVKELAAFSGGIEAYFVASEGITPFDIIDSKIKAIEQPYKTFENSYWMDAILRRASAMGIGVILDGQSGNATVSWGNWDAYSRYLLNSFQLKEYYKDKNIMAAKRNTHLLRLIASDLYQHLPYIVRKYRYQARGGENYFQSLSPINFRFMKSMQVENRFHHLGVDPWFLNKGNSFAQRTKLLGLAGFSHLGAMETKMPLELGMVRRDPTRDKRLIEFCINIPENQWVRNGHERRLIRRSMQGYLPDMIRLNTTVRGKQAADWIQRIAPQWQQITTEITTIGTGEPERKYLDINRIQNLLNNNRVLDISDGKNSDIRLLMRALIFTRFLRTEFGIE